MTPDREEHLLKMVKTLDSLPELEAFRAGIRENDGEMTTAIYAALIAWADYLHNKGGR